MRAKLLGLLALVLVILVVSWLGSHYFGLRVLNLPSHGGQNDSGKNDNSTGAPGVEVSVLISFGNGTRIWFNDSAVPTSYNFFNVTNRVTQGNLVAPWFEAQHSHFVEKILSFGCSLTDVTCSGYWSLWLWNENSFCWNYSPKGIDLLSVTEVRMIAWHFLLYDGSNPLPGRC